VRFCDEISGTSELGILNRADHAEISVYQEATEQNNYSGNLADICPVGALTDRDFRFKCRVWFLQSVPSICPGCSRGCNIEIHWNKQRPYQTPDERVMRIKPRYNEQVNKWWICDKGRYGFHSIDRDRITHFSIKENSQHALAESSLIIERITAIIKDLHQEDIAVFLSAKMTCEDLYLSKKLFVDALGIPSIVSTVPEKNPDSDGLLLMSDKNPNSLCTNIFDLNRTNYEDCVSKIRNRQIKMIFVFEHDFYNLSDEVIANAIRNNIQHIVYVGSNTNPTMTMADIVIPAATYAESNGSFINSDGRIQRITKAFEPLGQSIPCWKFIQQLSKALNIDFNFHEESDVFHAISNEYESFKGVRFENIGKEGMLLDNKEHAQVGQ
ncbi:MAG: molybdopterin-dependent oxidoreductase, partial [Chlamydiota bacterium]|nr:molybdopterin-dependent oxidoreductase [Chlamydiota bacterium]